MCDARKRERERAAPLGELAKESIENGRNERMLEGACSVEGLDGRVLGKGGSWTMRKVEIELSGGERIVT